MPGKEIVVVGASAGGLEAMKELVGKLPRNFPASVFIVWHTAPDAPGVLPKILAAAGGELPVANARNCEQIQPGRIYVAPPDHHLLIERGFVLLSRGPKENRFRPAVDPLFRSAAQAYGPRVAGVILSGGLDDGTAGLLAVKQQGGTAIVQDPAEALYPSMPQSAMKHVAVDYCLPAAAIASLLVRLTSTPEEAEGAYPRVRANGLSSRVRANKL